jgi:hypothetical protein
MDSVELLAFLQSLARFLGLTERLVNWLGVNDLHQFMDDCEDAIDQLEASKTSDDKKKAAKSLVSLIRHFK